MNVAPAPRAVVFDLDGTLLDSLPLVLAAITHALEPFGTRPTMDIFATLGGPPARFLPDFLRDVNHLPVAMARLEAYHRENTHLIQPFEGVPAMLADLRALGVQVAIWTGRDRISAERLLLAHQLQGYFATVVCGDDLPTHKPEPEGLREIMRRLGVSPSETVFVGDADVDVLGGAACGVDTILIRHNREIEAHITSKSWHAVISPAEAYALVLGRLSGRTKVTISPSENDGEAEKGP
jgi:HAD superfamily hydrolase (TIGR01509 family)